MLHRHADQAHWTGLLRASGERPRWAGMSAETNSDRLASMPWRALSGAALRGQFYNPWAERLCPVIIAIQRKPGIAGEGHRVSNQLCAIGARICSAGETHSGRGKINRASQI